MWSWKSDGNVLSTQQVVTRKIMKMIWWYMMKIETLQIWSMLLFWKEKNFWTCFFWDEGLHGNYFDLAKRDFRNTQKITGFGCRFCQNHPDWCMNFKSVIIPKEEQTATYSHSIVHDHQSPLTSTKNTEMFLWTKPNWQTEWIVDGLLLLIISCHDPCMFNQSCNQVYPPYTHWIQCIILFIVCRFGIFTNIQEFYFPPFDSDSLGFFFGSNKDAQWATFFWPDLQLRQAPPQQRCGEMG